MHLSNNHIVDAREKNARQRLIRRGGVKKTLSRRVAVTANTPKENFLPMHEPGETLLNDDELTRCIFGTNNIPDVRWGESDRIELNAI